MRRVKSQSDFRNQRVSCKSLKLFHFPKVFCAHDSIKDASLKPEQILKDLLIQNDILEMSFGFSFII